MSEAICEICNYKPSLTGLICCAACLYQDKINAECELEVLKTENAALKKENEELKAKDTGLSARMAYETYKSKYGVTNYNCLEAIEKILDELYPPHSEDSE